MEAVTPESVVVELLGAHGRVSSRERVMLAADTRRFTIGRGVGADVVIDDPHAAALHATVEVATDGAVRAADLGTLNGIIIAGQRHRGSEPTPCPDGMLQIGRTRLRVRTAHELLPPEKPDRTAATASRAPGWTAFFCGLYCAAYAAYLGWAEAPRDTTTVVVTTLMTTFFVSGAWIGIWALLSRIMLGEWRWIWHAAILFGVTTAYVSVESLLDVGWFVYALPSWETRSLLFAFIAIAVALYWHLTHASGLTQRRAAAVAILLPALAMGAGLWVQLRAQERDVNYIGVAEKIYVPALRVRQAGELKDYFGRVAQLKAVADRRRAAITADDEGELGFGVDFHQAAGTGRDGKVPPH